MSKRQRTTRSRSPAAPTIELQALVPLAQETADASAAISQNTAEVQFHLFPKRLDPSTWKTGVGDETQLPPKVLFVAFDAIYDPVLVDTALLRSRNCY